MIAMRRPRDGTGAALMAAMLAAGMPSPGTAADAPGPVQTETEAEAPAFLAGIEDVPLAPGLSERPGAGMVFDSPQGRIVEAVAAGASTAESVRAFYRATLPQLGWTRVGPDTWRREGEALRLDLAAQPGGGLRVRFSLVPDAAEATAPAPD